VTYVTQDRVEREARALARTAARTLDIASPGVEAYPVQKLLADALARARPERTALERAVEAVISKATVAADTEEPDVFASPEAEVTIRAVDGGYALDVDSPDEKLAERIRGALEGAIRNGS
jgi:hypothetical protein